MSQRCIRAGCFCRRHKCIDEEELYLGRIIDAPEGSRGTKPLDAITREF
jgi:hypothetical protein